MTELSQIPVSQECSLDEQELKQLTLSQIVDRMAVLLQDEVAVERKQMDLLTEIFTHKLRSSQKEDPEGAEARLLVEARFNDLSNQFRTIERRRSEALAALQIKHGTQMEALLEEFKSLMATSSDFASVYQRFQEVRTSWQSLRPLTQQDDSRLGKLFVQLRAAFYAFESFDEQLKNADFAKHLQQKQELLAELKTWSESADILEALQVLSNDLVQRWRDIGPVAPELRAEIEGAYKELSTSIFKRHQAYQDELKAEEANHAQAKTKIIDDIKAYLADKLPSTASEWHEATNQIKQYQQDFRSIGHAGRKLNHELYQQYREVCNLFFEKRHSYYELKNKVQADAVALRKSLIERATELAQSDKFAETVELLKGLQSEWQKLPHIRKEEGDLLWAEFRKPFDAFYERKRAYDAKQHSYGKKNEEQKRSLLAELKSISELAELPEGLKDKLQNIKDSWRKIGRASAKVNDELWTEFCGLNDILYAKLRALQDDRRSEQLKQRKEQLSAEPQALKGELQFLQRKADRLRAELRNYDNNINFLSASAKSGNALLKEVERKREKLAVDLERVEQEIKVLKG